MFCGNCGKKLPDDAAFCPECGAKAQKLDAPISEEKNIPAIPEKAQQKKQGKLKSILSGIGSLIIIVAVIYSFTKHPTSELKDIVFEDYGDITFGEAVKENVRNTSWESEKVDSTHYIVTVSGFIPEIYSNVELSFDINYADDYVYASAKEVILDGDYYDDAFTIAFVFGYIYVRYLLGLISWSGVVVGLPTTSAPVHRPSKILACGALSGMRQMKAYNPRPTRGLHGLHLTRLKPRCL